MSDTNDDKGSGSIRQKRVRRLKYTIVILGLILLFTPATLCIWMFVHIRRIDNEVSHLQNVLNYYVEAAETMKYADLVDEIKQEEPTLPNQDVTGNNRNPQADGLSTEELYSDYRKIYLTFDDGPSSNTDAILDVLKEYDVKATFFVIGKDERAYEDVYRRIVDEGHTLGMHSYSHEYSEVYKDTESFKADLKKLRDFLYLVTGETVSYYRFPGGSSNDVSRVDMREFINILNDEGIVYYDWNVSSQDASPVILSKEKIYFNSTSKLEDYSEAVILFHDTGNKSTTVDALSSIIEYIQEMDKTVILPITMDTNPIQHLSAEDNNTQ